MTYVIAVLNKETGYCVILLIPSLMLSHTTWKLPPISAERKIRLCALLAASTAVLIGIRFVLFDGPGGFGFHTQQSSVAHLSWKSVYSLIVNVAGLCPFAINGLRPTLLTQIIVGAYAVAILAIAYAIVSRGSGERLLLGLAFLSAIPALPVIGWIRPSLEHTRHLYLPSVWVALFIAVPMSRLRIRTAFFVVFALLQVAALNWNISVYRRMIQLTDTVAAGVARDFRQAPGNVTEIRLVNVPPDPDGVWYFDTQLQHEVEAAVGVTAVRLCGLGDSCGGTAKSALVYTWDPVNERLVR